MIWLLLGISSLALSLRKGHLNLNDKTIDLGWTCVRTMSRCC